MTKSWDFYLYFDILIVEIERSEKMAKTLLVLSIILLLLSGCSKSGTLNCTRQFTNEDGYEVKDTMIVNYENNIVTKVEHTNITATDPDLLDFTISFGETFSDNLNKVNGFNLKYDKYSEHEVRYVMTIDYKDLDVVALKNEFGEDFDSDLYSLNMAIKDFKKKNLSDYTCK